MEEKGRGREQGRERERENRKTGKIKWSKKDNGRKKGELVCVYALERESVYVCVC